MESKKLSLSLAKQFRLCPPSRIAKDPTHAANVRKHRSLCPYCSDDTLEELASWDALANKLISFNDSERTAEEIEAVGQGSICPVTQDRGRWQEGYFYNPPAVLVLARTASISGDVLVAQTYHDTTLSGPGDLILEGERSPVGEIFFEAWNTYTLRSRDLGPAAGEVSEEVVEAVKSLQKDHSAYPTWAGRPEPMEEHDPRISFREMEVEVGYVFASEAVSGLLQKHARPSLRLIQGTLQETIEGIRRIDRGIQWSVSPQTIEQALATARFPPERYAMAAASEDREVLSANLVTIRAGKIQAIAPVDGEIFQRIEEPEGLVIGGRISTPQEVEILDILCFLQTSEGDFVSADGLDRDDQGHFRARFPVSSVGHMELFVAALREAEDD
ncbi:MAG: hypothetical protein AB1512_11035 [Thermodesulfobacteriota bacterium]